MSHLALPSPDLAILQRRTELLKQLKRLVPEAVWRARYAQINDFERLLRSSRTIVAKFYLHISAEEQRERLLARERDVSKAWKLSAGDWEERDRWDAYRAAYEDALAKCASPRSSRPIDGNPRPATNRRASPRALRSCATGWRARTRRISAANRSPTGSRKWTPWPRPTRRASA